MPRVIRINIAPEAWKALRIKAVEEGCSMATLLGDLLEWTASGY
jgi:hypothetical protein